MKNEVLMRPSTIAVNNPFIIVPQTQRQLPDQAVTAISELSVNTTLVQSAGAVSVATALAHNTSRFDKMEQSRQFSQERVARVFSEFGGLEMPHFLGNIFAIYGHRGCIQNCSGCHSGALPEITTANWKDVELVMEALRQSAIIYSTPVQQKHKKGLIETFRDSDSAHLNFPTGEGIGDFSRLVHSTIGRKTKIMTAGVRYVSVGNEIHLHHKELEQLALAGPHARKLSVSISSQTRWYRELGRDIYAQLLARTFEACLAGASEKNQVYFDLMCFSDENNPPNLCYRDNTNPSTEAVKELFFETLRVVDARYLTQGEKEYLKQRLLSDDIDGTTFYKVELPDRKVGFWVAPYLNTGRASVGKDIGVSLQDTNTNDWFPVLEGDDKDTIGIETQNRSIFVTRGGLKNRQLRHGFVDQLRDIQGNNLLAEVAKLHGNWPSFFRSEIDLSPRASDRFDDKHFAMAPGSNFGPIVSLLVSDLVGGEWQVVLPFKRLTI